MDSEPRATSSAARPALAVRALVLAIGLLSASGLAGCTGSKAPAPAWTVPPAPAAAVTTPAPVRATTPAPVTNDAVAIEATWAARPAFTKVDPRTEEAYEFALRSPQILQWIACYCGCAAMGHRSNLDCYFKPRSVGLATQYEEHASYCAICVNETLMVKRLLAEGQSLRQIRDAIDAQFGGSAPGTPTELPPA